MFFGRKNLSTVLGYSLGEYVIIIFFYLIFYIIYRLLRPFAEKFGALYHGERIDHTPKPDEFKAQMFRRKEEYTHAIKEYRKLLHQFPKRSDFIFEIAEIYRKDLSDKERALNAYAQFLMHPGAMEYPLLVGMARERIEELEGKGYRRPDIVEIDTGSGGEW
jgi:hypothetical protein